jgi:hypothetical protein
MQNKIYLKNENMVFRKIADECVLVPIRNNVADLRSIYSLNPVGARIWELIDGETGLEQIKKVLQDEFEATDEQLKKDIENFTEQLMTIKAIKEVV